MKKILKLLFAIFVLSLSFSSLVFLTACDEGQRTGIIATFQNPQNPVAHNATHEDLIARLQVQAVYRNGSTVTITPTVSMLSGQLTSGTTSTITVTVGEHSDSFQVIVSPRPTKVGITATLMNPQEAFAFDTTLIDILERLTVVENFSDNSTFPLVVTADMLSGNLIVGQTTTITVTVGGFSDIFEVTVSHPRRVSLTATWDDFETPVAFNAAMSSLPARLTVVANYDDGTKSARLNITSAMLSANLAAYHGRVATVTVRNSGLETTFQVKVTPIVAGSPAQFNVNLTGGNSTGLTWGLFEGNTSLPSTNIVGGRRYTAEVGSTITLRWNIDVTLFRTVINFGAGNEIFRSNDDGNIVFMSDNVTATGANWFEFTILVEEIHAMSNTTVIINTNFV
ncbi:MAG: hypothetical protein FWC11_02240 [Firmicutes bacterium]|nr:hypothetical protein [Bacillota bacterium]MCL2255658.1 hypothetical protein [Bacillota bacterium]